nr:MAG TPA: hypothetical protein [Caudoviricetes sp.]
MKVCETCSTSENDFACLAIRYSYDCLLMGCIIIEIKT